MKNNVYPAKFTLPPRNESRLKRDKGGFYCLLVAVVLAGLAVPGMAQSNLYVATNGADNTDAGRGQSWTLPYLTISNGVAHAPTAGDTVWVSNGIYDITAVISITNGITVQSTNGPDYTFVNGGATTRCFYLDHPNAVLSGFAITNGRYTGSTHGGGVACWQGLVTNCVISGNEQARNGYYGGGIYVGGTGTIVNCIISNNIGFHGGGMYFQGTMSNCTIANNVSTGSSVYYGGAGVWMAGGTGVNCTIIGNATTSACGGGVSFQSGTLIDSTISGNFAQNGGGVAFWSGGTLQNSTVSANSVTNGSYGGGGVFANYPGGGGNLLGCTISCNTNFDTDNYGGGGIFFWYSCLVSNCVITGNVSYAAGGNGAGGAFLRNNNCVLKNSLIIGNRAAGSGTSRGGGIRCDYGGTVENCEIRENVSNDRGAGVQMWRGGRLINCLITGNTNNDYGAGVTAARLTDNTGYVHSCTIVSNKGSTRAGIYFDDLTTSAPVTNCIVYLNTANAGQPQNIYTGDATTNYFWYCCVAEQTPVTQGNITNNPLFAGTNAGNYRLTRNSPCVNTGTNQDWMTNAVDLDNRRRIDKLLGRVDMGAYEFIYSGSFFNVH